MKKENQFIIMSLLMNRCRLKKHGQSRLSSDAIFVKPHCLKHFPCDLRLLFVRYQDYQVEVEMF